MARTIVTLCDYCLTEGNQQVAGLPYRVGVNLPGESRWGWVEVDLCPDHAEGLTDLSLFLSKYGRTFQPDDGPTVKAAGRVPCPQCGKSLKTQDSLTKHIRALHENPQDPGPFVCDVDGCGRGFPKAQGLSMHIRRTHQGFDPNRG